MKIDFLKAIKQRKRPFYLDGAMGSLVQAKLKSDSFKGPFEILNVKRPKLFQEIHREYQMAGADIVITNTFGANWLKLSEFGLAGQVNQINKAAIRNARIGAPQCWVAADIGPLGKYIEPLGKLTFKEVLDIYTQQVKALEPADLYIIETMDDLKMLKAAIIAVKETKKPVIASMTFQEGRTPTGTDPLVFLAVCEGLGVDIVGANCSEGSEGLLKVARILSQNTNLPLAIQPNAGLPELIDGETVFKASPRHMAKYAQKFVALGVNILGGCCGTTPAHINEIRKKTEKLKPAMRKNKIYTCLCSRTKTVCLKNKTLIIGERINPTGRSKLQKELRKGKMNIIKEEAAKQTEEGADLIDVNVGVAGLKEENTLTRAVASVENTVDRPLVIDTADHRALELALMNCAGKPLVNSVNGSRQSLKKTLSLVKKYGAAVIALCLDDAGIPKTSAKRIAVARKIIREALRQGIRKEDIVVDLITLTIASNKENEKITLDSLKKAKKLGLRTVLGVSNISHGLWDRPKLNLRFLRKAKKAGLDLAIFNPQELSLKLSRKKTGDLTLKFQQEKDSFKEDLKNTLKDGKTSLNLLENKFKEAIMIGDKEGGVALAKEIARRGQIIKINKLLSEALEKVGEKFDKKEFFLPHVILAAEAGKEVLKIVNKNKKIKKGQRVAKIVFATVKNDIHDIGKNIVIAVLESYNFEAIDLGKDVDFKKIINEAIRHKADAIALSALMTTTVGEMENVSQELKKRKIKIPLLIGGAVVTEEYAKGIGAHYSKDALGAVAKIKQILSGSIKV